MFYGSSRSLSSRYIVNDLSANKQSRSNYQQHKNKINEIKKAPLLNKIVQSNHLVAIKNLSKYKQLARNQSLKSRQVKLTVQNSNMLEKLKGIYNAKSKLLPRVTKSLEKISNRSLETKRLNQKRLQQNLIILDRLQTSRQSHRQKETITKQIKQYLSHRARLRKKILPSEQKQVTKELNYSRTSSRASLISRSQSLKSISGL